MVGFVQGISTKDEKQCKKTKYLLIGLFLFSKLFFCLVRKQNIIRFYVVLVDNSTFFLKDELHAVETMKVFKGLILFSSFRPNKWKCEVSGVENEWKSLLYSLAQQKV